MRMSIAKGHLHRGFDIVTGVEAGHHRRALTKAAASQAQLTAATEAGEAFKRIRGDVRRERKLVQKVASLEEEVIQLKGQVNAADDMQDLSVLRSYECSLIAFHFIGTTAT